MLQMGATQRAVAINMNCSKMTITRLVARLRQSGRTTDRPRSGRPKVTTPQDDRFLRVLHLRNRIPTVTSSAANSLGHPEVELYGGGSVMVWGGICGDEKTELVSIEGSLTAQRYTDNILRPVVLPFI
ncbi:uncharacterized protein [Haliotis cracherodii]|uniref:uncharacterized protein n=1 Tax=Haliotis cracherodii TaxID=6455 RepID=UPI0039EB5573